VPITNIPPAEKSLQGSFISAPKVLESVRGTRPLASKPAGAISMFDRMMASYADTLMKTPVRIAVVLVFIGYGAFCIAVLPQIEEAGQRCNMNPICPRGEIAYGLLTLASPKLSRIDS
jgi:hypothetical protein